MILSLLEERETKSPLDDFWYRPVWGSGSSGSTASPSEALGLSAWWAAITDVAGTVSSIPLKLYRRDGDDHIPARDDPRYHLLHRTPTRFHTSMEWRELGQGLLMSRGNYFNRMLRDRTGRVVEFEPLHPDRVTVEMKAGRLTYRVHRKGGPEDYDASEMFHLRGFGANGLVGYSVVELARRSLGLSLELERHGSELMKNKARPGGVLATDQVLPKEHRAALEREWDQAYTGGGIGKTVILDGGLSWQTIGFSAEDAQYIESRKFQIAEVARWTNVPMHRLKELDNATYSNIEQQSIEYVTSSIAPRCERWEQRLDNALLDESEREELFFKFSLEGLLRGDSESRGKFYKELFQMGSLSPNDIRRMEDMNGVEGGDQYFVQLNLVPLDKAGDPFGDMDEAAGQALAGRREVRALPAARLEERSLRERRRLMDTYTRLLEHTAGSLVRRELADLRRLLDAVDDGDVDDFLRRLDIFGESLPETVRRVMGPQLAAYVELVAAAAADEVELDELDENRVTGWRTKYVEALGEGHTSETLGRLRDTMTEAEGDPFANARGMLDRWEKNRAAAIGLREAVTAGGGAAALVYAFAGRGAVWRTTGSENCPYCNMLDGRRVGPGERFLEAGDTLDPGGDTEPLTVGRGVGHPQAHGGCDCSVSAG